MAELTSKEKFYLRYLTLEDNEIALRTHFAPGTVKTYKRFIYKKLNVKNKAQALFKALALGLITLEEIITE